jgi:Na+/H+-dicarboxylate symporter
MYIADAFGYLGSVAVLFLKQFFGLHLSWTSFFINAVFIISSFGIAGTILAAVYFRKKYDTNEQNIRPVYAA